MLFLRAQTSEAAPLHGIGFAKGCNTPIVIGQLYTCDVLTINNIDTAGDTLTITSVIDVVHATAGDQTSSNLLPTLTLSFTGGAFCGPGQLICTLPPGSSIFTNVSYGFYIAQPGDPNPLADTATLTWQDLCTSLALNCPVGNQHASSGSSAALVTATPTSTNTPTNTPTPTPTNTATPTITPTRTSTATAVVLGSVTPLSVGGVGFLQLGGSDAPGGSGSGSSPVALAVISGTALFVLGASGWYVKRRRLARS